MLKQRDSNPRPRQKGARVPTALLCDRASEWVALHTSKTSQVTCCRVEVSQAHRARAGQISKRVVEYIFGRVSRGQPQALLHAQTVCSSVRTGAELCETPRAAEPGARGLERKYGGIADWGGQSWWGGDRGAEKKMKKKKRLTEKPRETESAAHIRDRNQPKDYQSAAHEPQVSRHLQL